ncbi:MAG: lysozyme [Cyanobacteria bacterium P01_F01_bin.13]
MQFIPLEPKAPTTDSTGKIKVTTSAPFRIVNLDKQPSGNILVTVYGQATSLGDKVELNPDDFDIPDALKVVGQTYLKTSPVGSNSVSTEDRRQWGIISVGDFILGELKADKLGHWAIKTDAGLRYIFKKHATVAIASVMEAQQGDELIPQSGLKLIMESEGFARIVQGSNSNPKPSDICEAYPDPLSGGEPFTIGYGNTKYPNGKKVNQGDSCTREQAEEFLLAHVEEECKAALEKIPTWEQMSSGQRAALYSFAFNLGARFYKATNFESITRVCDSPDRWHDHAWIEAQFVKYRNPGTSVEKGLRRRRIAEARLFCS